MRHPFILQNEVDQYVTKWGNTGLTEGKFNAKLASFKDWVYDNKEYFDLDARVAIEQAHNNNMYAIVLWDIYDKKSSCK